MGESRRILLTGAAGRIGTSFRDHAAELYTLRLADRSTQGLTAWAAAQPVERGHEVVALDVADLAACRAACLDVDTVVHLAANASPRADFYASLLDDNVKGVYNIFRAAADAGCHRVVFASSGQAVMGYPPDVQVAPDMPVWPVNMYGATKCFGEAVAACFAEAEGLSSIAVRLGAYDADWLTMARDVDNLGAYLSPRDANHLFERCIETPAIRFAIVHGLSNNRYPRLDLTATRTLLAYEPRDDAFALFLPQADAPA